MSKVLVSESNLTAIADSIRTLKNVDETYTPSEMAEALNEIVFENPSGDIPENLRNDVEAIKQEQVVQNKDISDIKSEQNVQNREIATIKTTLGTNKRVFERVLFDYDGMWNTEDEARFAEVVDIYGQFETIVSGFGNRYDVENATAVPAMIKFLNALRAKYPNSKVFNYVELGNRAGQDQCFTEWMIKSYVNYTAHLGGELIEQEADGTRKYSGGISMDGVFFDECEYPFGVSRDRMNLAFTAAHESNLIAFPNCYSPELSMFTDSATATLPDGTLANPNGVSVALADGDYFLLESCFSMPGSTSTIITDKTSWGRALTFSTKFRSKWSNLKMIPLNYVSNETVKNTKLLQEVRSYCVLASYILGCDGCCMQVGTSYSPNLSNFDVPEIIRDSITAVYPDIRTLTTNHYRIESNGHYFEYIMNIEGADDNHIDFSKDFWDYVYFLVDGAKTTNIWLSVFSIYDELSTIVKSVDMQYNNDPELMQMVKVENQTGVSPYVARADHAHKAGPYIMLKKDEWDKTFKNYLSIKPFDKWRYTNVKKRISTDTSLHIETGKNEFCELDIPKEEWEANSLLGKTLEFGVDSLELSENCKDTFTITAVKYANNKWTNMGTIMFNTNNKSQTFNESGLCARFRTPESVEEFDRLYFTIRSNLNEEEASYTVNGFYIRDVDEKSTGKWYRNIIPTFEKWKSYNTDVIEITEIKSDYSANISCIGQGWSHVAPPDIKWGDVGIQKGKTIEFGVKVKGAELNGLEFSLVSANKQVAIVNLGNTDYSGGVYKESERYLSARYTIPEDQSGVQVRIGKRNGRLYDVEIIDMYLYDLSEEVIPEDETFSKTELQIHRVLNEVKEYKVNTLYFSPNEIQMTDSLGNVTKYRSGSITHIGDIVTSSDALVDGAEEGDLYINKTTKEMFVLFNGKWTYLGKLAE